jgi:protein SCO1/2
MAPINPPACSRTLLVFAGLLLLLAPVLPLHADGPLPSRADLEQKLGTRIPLDLIFTDDTGKSVPLRDYFGQRPVILQLGYNHCWLMCDVITGALVRSMQDMRLSPGTDFTVLFVSIDPNEKWQLAARKRADYIRGYGRDRTGPGWHFLTGDAPEIAALAGAVGFHYYYDPAARLFVHPSGLIILTPGGVASKYFYGVEFDPHLLQQSLLAASGGTIGGKVEALLLLCCEWNPLTGKYGVLISILLKIFCLGTVALLFGYMVVWLRRDARRRRIEEETPVQ